MSKAVEKDSHIEAIAMLSQQLDDGYEMIPKLSTLVDKLSGVTAFLYMNRDIAKDEITRTARMWHDRVDQIEKKLLLRVTDLRKSRESTLRQGKEDIQTILTKIDIKCEQVEQYLSLGEKGELPLQQVIGQYKDVLHKGHSLMEMESEFLCQYQLEFIPADLSSFKEETNFGHLKLSCLNVDKVKLVKPESGKLTAVLKTEEKLYIDTSCFYSLSDLNYLAVDMCDPTGAALAVETVRCKDSTRVVEILFTPLVTGLHTLYIKVYDQNIEDSPMTIDVEDIKKREAKKTTSDSVKEIGIQVSTYDENPRNRTPKMADVTTQVMEKDFCPLEKEESRKQDGTQTEPSWDEIETKPKLEDKVAIKKEPLWDGCWDDDLVHFEQRNGEIENLPGQLHYPAHSEGYQCVSVRRSPQRWTFNKAIWPRIMIKKECPGACVLTSPKLFRRKAFNLPSIKEETCRDALSDNTEHPSNNSDNKATVASQEETACISDHPEIYQIEEKRRDLIDTQIKVFKQQLGFRKLNTSRKSSSTDIPTLKSKEDDPRRETVTSLRHLPTLQKTDTVRVNKLKDVASHIHPSVCKTETLIDLEEETCSAKEILIPDGTHTAKKEILSPDKPAVELTTLNVIETEILVNISDKSEDIPYKRPEDDQTRCTSSISELSFLESGECDMSITEADESRLSDSTYFEFGSDTSDTSSELDSKKSRSKFIGRRLSAKLTGGNLLENVDDEAAAPKVDINSNISDDGVSQKFPCLRKPTKESILKLDIFSTTLDKEATLRKSKRMLAEIISPIAAPNQIKFTPRPVTHKRLRLSPDNHTGTVHERQDTVNENNDIDHHSFDDDVNTKPRTATDQILKEMSLIQITEFDLGKDNSNTNNSCWKNTNQLKKLNGKVTLNVHTDIARSEETDDSDVCEDTIPPKLKSVVHVVQKENSWMFKQNLPKFTEQKADPVTAKVKQDEAKKSNVLEEEETETTRLKSIVHVVDRENSWMFKNQKDQNADQLKDQIKDQLPTKGTLCKTKENISTNQLPSKTAPAQKQPSYIHAYVKKLTNENNFKFNFSTTTDQSNIKEKKRDFSKETTEKKESIQPKSKVNDLPITDKASGSCVTIKDNGQTTKEITTKIKEKEPLVTKVVKKNVVDKTDKSTSSKSPLKDPKVLCMNPPIAGQTTQVESLISKHIKKIPGKVLKGNLELTIGDFGHDSRYNLAYPIGVTVNKLGDIIVCDNGNNMVKIFDKRGKHKMTLGSTTSNTFLRPSAVVTNEKNEIFIRDDHNIQVFNTAGCFVRCFGRGILKHPYGLLLNSYGDILTLDVCKHKPRIVIFSQQGKLLKEGPFEPLVHHKQGEPPSKCRFLGLQGNNVITTDLGKSKVYVTTYAGKELGQFGAFGSGGGQFCEPAGVTVDGNGNILIADSKNNRIQVYDPAGTFLCRVHLSCYIKRPSDIFLTEDGHLLIANFLDHNIKMYKLVSEDG